MLPIRKILKKRLKSTNLYAARVVASRQLRETSWIRARHQYGGKGQGNHNWTSEPGKNITGTLVIYPDCLPGADQYFLSIVLSLAASDFLELFLDEVRIKWPNDLYAGNRKIGGILIETAIMGSYIEYAILGIGLNINQMQFPVALPNPTSLALLTQREYDLEELEDLFLESFTNRYQMLKMGKKIQLRDEYLSKLYRFKEFAPYRTGGKWFRARIIGVSQFGHLVLEDENGKMREFAFQEVEFIR